MKITLSRRINLDFNPIQDGRYSGPPEDGSAKLGSLFPTTFAVEVRPPFLLFRVKYITPKPWPISVAGLLPQFTTDENSPGRNRGKAGKGPKVPWEYNIQRDHDFSESLIKGAIGVLPECKIRGTDIRWYEYFGIVTDENTDLKQMRSVEESRPFRA